MGKPNVLIEMYSKLIYLRNASRLGRGYTYNYLIFYQWATQNPHSHQEGGAMTNRNPLI